MKILIIYYSRTGTTRKVAELLATKLGAEIEELKDTVDRSGAMGYLMAGKDASLKKLTKLEPLKHNLAEFELVIIGTPIWSWNLSVPVRTFLEEQKNKISKAAFFCTMGGSGDTRAKKDLEKIIGKGVITDLSLTTKEVVQNQHEEKVAEFVDRLMSAIN